jgi:hydrogenase maturation protease
VEAETLLVAGVGNPLFGDDAIGPSVIDNIKHNFNNLTSLTFQTEISPFDLPLLADIYDDIILVDAADMDLADGEYRWFDGKKLAKDSTQGLHSWGVAEGLSMLYALKPTMRVKLLLIQISQLEWGNNLSPLLKSKINEISDQLKEECNKHATSNINH